MRWLDGLPVPDVRRALLALALCAGVAMTPAVSAPAAHAGDANGLTVMVQPLNGCLVSRVGNLYCQGILGPPVAITADPAANPALWSGVAYALCWTTPTGTTYPPGASCAPTGSALATGHNNAYLSASTFPVTFAGTRYEGCEGFPNVGANSFLFLVGNTGPCVFSFPYASTGGIDDATATFTLDVGEATQPVIRGDLPVDTAGRFTVGQRTPLQYVTCMWQESIGNLWVQCPGVMLNWRILSGGKVCALATNTKPLSKTFGTVRVRFRRPGTCAVQGSYPAVPGQSVAFTTPVYSYTVTSKG